MLRRDKVGAIRTVSVNGTTIAVPLRSVPVQVRIDPCSAFREFERQTANSGAFRRYPTQAAPKISEFSLISGPEPMRLVRARLPPPPTSSLNWQENFKSRIPRNSPVLSGGGEGCIGLSLSRDAIGARSKASPARRLSRPLSAQAVGGRKWRRSGSSAWWKPRNRR